MPKRVRSTDLGFQPPLIDEEFRKLFEDLMDEKEDAKLEFMLVEEGEARDPIIVWAEENIVVEGHRRTKFCRKHNLPYTVQYKSFDSREAVKKWMIEYQLHGRRNLTDAQRTYYIGKEYNATEASSAQVAKKNKTSRRTVFRASKFAKAADAHETEKPGTLKRILRGEAGRSQEKIIKSAPIICDRCIRVGKVKNCSKCQELQEQAAKRKRPHVPKDLFDQKEVKKQIKAEEPPKEPYEALKGLVTKTAGEFTRFLATPEGGEVNQVWDRLRVYMGWAGLTWFEKGKGEPKFLPLAGVRALMELAEKKGQWTEVEVLAVYEKAAGVWIPPKTKDYRNRRGT